MESMGLFGDFMWFHGILWGMWHIFRILRSSWRFFDISWASSLFVCFQYPFEFFVTRYSRSDISNNDLGKPLFFIFQNGRNFGKFPNGLWAPSPPPFQRVYLRFFLIHSNWPGEWGYWWPWWLWWPRWPWWPWWLWWSWWMMMGMNTFIYSFTAAYVCFFCIV